jgi:hypothetical protein
MTPSSGPNAAAAERLPTDHDSDNEALLAAAVYAEDTATSNVPHCIWRDWQCKS